MQQVVECLSSLTHSLMGSPAENISLCLPKHTNISAEHDPLSLMKLSASDDP